MSQTERKDEILSHFDQRAAFQVFQLLEAKRSHIAPKVHEDGKTFDIFEGIALVYDPKKGLSWSITEPNLVSSFPGAEILVFPIQKANEEFQELSMSEVDFMDDLSQLLVKMKDHSTPTVFAYNHTEPRLEMVSSYRTHYSFGIELSLTEKGEKKVNFIAPGVVNIEIGSLITLLNDYTGNK